jgi:NADH-quinone oxidoreductase subunit M
MPSFPWLTLIIFLPLAGGLLILCLARRPHLCRWTALFFTLADFTLVCALFALNLGWEPGTGGRWLLAEDHLWIESLGIRYSLGLDGISQMLILLTAFLSVLTVLVSWREIDNKVRAFHFFLLFTETSILGVFLSTDLFLFYLFWEVQLVPIFFLIGIWGHENRIYATIKFLLYSLAGSLLMLVALIGLYLVHGAQTGQYTFALERLVGTSLTPSTEPWLYAAFLFAFAIKIPILPVHTWLPDAHTQAPTAGSVILAGLLLKTGAYALLRFGFPLFPAAARFSIPLLLVLGLIALFYTGWIALAQKDIKRLVAYSSIGHMGLVMVGISVWNVLTLPGAMLQMISHGVTTPALFILVGMLDERVHTREMVHLGGLWRKMPGFSAFFLFFAMASLGLPGLNNFVGEFLILVGTLKQIPAAAWVGFGGLVFTVIYVLLMVQKTIFGEPRNDEIRRQPLQDINLREVVILAPLAAAVLFIGIHPQPILDLFQGPVEALLGSLPR